VLAGETLRDGWFARDRLHRAAAEGNLARARALIAEGAPLNAFDAIGYAPLHYAVKNGWFEMVRLLLDAGADINARDPQSMPPVAVASPRMIDFLLQFGAEPLSVQKE
jgi:ankyrin repeat protein